MAMVTRCAKIFILAWCDVGGVCASQQDFTRIGGTDIVVIAVGWPDEDAVTCFTVVPLGACVAVITRFIDGLMQASGGRVTTVSRARVVIRTLEVLTCGANSVCTDIVSAANIAIAALGGIGGMGAACSNIAVIVRARIIICTVDCDARHAATRTAFVTCCTSIAIVTCEAVIGGDDLAFAGFGNAV